MKIACVGQCVVDLIYPVDSFFEENKKYRIKDLRVSTGGPAANAAILNAKWNQTTQIIGRIGNDVFGDKIISDLRNMGVDVSYLKKSDQTSSISTIIVSNGKRTILNHPMDDLYDDVKVPDNVGVILVDGHELEASLEILDNNPSAISIIDAGTYKPYLKKLLKRVDYLVASEDFAEQYTRNKINLDDPLCIKECFDLLKTLNEKNLVVTLGGRGVIYEVSGEIWLFDSYDVEEIDSSGAGDIFHGAFAYGLANGYKLNEVIKLASAAAAISVTRKGCQESIPALDEVKHFIENIKIPNFPLMRKLCDL